MRRDHALKAPARAHGGCGMVTAVTAAPSGAVATPGIPSAIPGTSQQLPAGGAEPLFNRGMTRCGELATRLLGSMMLQHAPCPVLVASPAGKADTHRVAAAEHAAAVR